MQHSHSKFLLIAVTLTVMLLVGAVAALSSACVGPLGCGLGIAGCSYVMDACQDSFVVYDPNVPFWDGPGSIQSTPTPEVIIDATAIPFSPEPTPQVSEPTDPLGNQQPADVSDVRQPRVKLKGDGTDTATVLILMNGSDLESEYAEATSDLSEMAKATKSDRVNILVETVGTKKWARTFGISARHSQRWKVANGRLELVDDSLAQLDTTVPSTLSDFIRWGAENYPADRYILILWDHGGGPVYGFGYDEYQPYTSTLTIDEMQIALNDGGVYFDFIGMDSCLMSSMEVCCALYDYCDYTLLSEDFEPGCGWSYTGWLSALAQDPAIDTRTLCRSLIDDAVRYCEANLEENGGMTLALIDQAYMKRLYPAWVEFAYANEQALLDANYSQLRQSTGRTHPLLRSISDWFTSDDSTLEDYCITDILSVAQNISSEESEALIAALRDAVLYFGATSDETTLTGLSVTLPYGDAEFYGELKRVFHNAGFDMDYVNWLERFTEVETDSDYYDFGDWGGWDDHWSDTWGGWDDHQGGFDWDDWFYDDGTDDDWANDDWFSWFFGN